MPSFSSNPANFQYLQSFVELSPISKKCNEIVLFLNDGDGIFRRFQIRFHLLFPEIGDLIVFHTFLQTLNVHFCCPVKDFENKEGIKAWIEERQAKGEQWLLLLRRDCIALEIQVFSNISERAIFDLGITFSIVNNSKYEIRDGILLLNGSEATLPAFLDLCATPSVDISGTPIPRQPYSSLRESRTDQSTAPQPTTRSTTARETANATADLLQRARAAFFFFFSRNQYFLS